MEGQETNKGEAVKISAKYAGNSLGCVPTSEWRSISMEEDPAQCSILNFLESGGHSDRDDVLNYCMGNYIGGLGLQ